MPQQTPEAIAAASKFADIAAALIPGYQTTHPHSPAVEGLELVSRLVLEAMGALGNAADPKAEIGAEIVAVVGSLVGQVLTLEAATVATSALLPIFAAAGITVPPLAVMIFVAAFVYLG